MAYQIDFTASNYTVRRWRKAILRISFLAAVGGAAYGVHYVYTTYNEPTLNMKLAEYEAVTHPIEEMNQAWDAAEKEYNSMLRYYRLVWAANPTNFLAVMASVNAPYLQRGFQPLGWTLKTGGECRLDYRYEFGLGDKAEQAQGLVSNIVNAVTSVVAVTDGKVDVQGVQLENLLHVDDLNITARFSLPDVKAFPAKEKALSDCVNEIGAMRKKTKESKIAKESDVKGISPTAQALMMAYLTIGKDKPGFPDVADVINVSGWFDRADQFILKNKIPGDDAERRRLKEFWNKVGNARFPWDRFRVLDNADLVNRTKALGEVSDGVKRFKGFLEQRRADYRRRLEPLIDGYDRNDVFNKPFIESDLKDRVAKVAGIANAMVSFKDEPGVEPAVLEKEDEKFFFTWVRWTLTVGGESSSAKATEDKAGTGAAEQNLPLTLERLADCAKRVLELGPGYALDSVKISFDGKGGVSGALFEGLLPVKKVESKKEKADNVN